MSLRAPHAHEGITIPTLMFKVTLALLPAALLGVLQGLDRALALLLERLVLLGPFGVQLLQHLDGQLQPGALALGVAGGTGLQRGQLGGNHSAQQHDEPGHVNPNQQNRQGGKRAVDTSWYTSKDKRYATLSFVFQGTLLLVSLFVPLRIGTPLFTVGCVLFAFALVGFMAAFHAYASTPKGETVVRGVYRLSRNPMYFFYEVGALAVCIASASLWLLLATIPLILVTHGVILGEERYCMTTYGEDYARYKARTPRYFLLK